MDIFGENVEADTCTIKRNFVRLCVDRFFFILDAEGRDKNTLMPNCRNPGIEFFVEIATNRSNNPMEARERNIKTIIEIDSKQYVR